MVERIARAICADLDADEDPDDRLRLGYPAWQEFIPTAIAAMAAMLEDDDVKARVRAHCAAAFNSAEDQ